MGWPQVTWIALAAVGVAIALTKHGQTSTVNVWHNLIGASIGAGLLYAGGFFA